MSKLIVLVGLPGSGKTTWATNYIEENPTALRLSRDAIRGMLSGKYNWKKENEKLVLALMKSCVRICLDKIHDTDRTLIIDDTNLSAKRRMNWVSIALEHECNQIEFVYFNVPENECKRRRSEGNRGTNGKDWSDIIYRMNLYSDIPFTPREEAVYKGEVSLKIIEPSP